MLPVPFAPFRSRSGTGFDPYAETPREGTHQALSSHPPSGAHQESDRGLHLVPPEPPQLVLPSLARRLSSIVKQEVMGPAVITHHVSSSVLSASSSYQQLTMPLSSMQWMKLFPVLSPHLLSHVRGFLAHIQDFCSTNVRTWFLAL